MIIFFDLDDTLIDHSQAMRSAAINLHSSLRLAGTAEDFVAAWRTAQGHYYPRYLSQELTYETSCRLRLRDTVSAELKDHEADELFGRYIRFYQSQWRRFPDTLPALDRLRSHTLGIITNGPSTQQRAKLDAVQIADRFRHILISEECGQAKPSSLIFQNACQRADALPHQVIHVGDHLDADVRGAREAGLRAIWLDRHGLESPPAECEVVHSLLELVDLLEKDEV